MKTARLHEVEVQAIDVAWLEPLIGAHRMEQLRRLPPHMSCRIR
jgi:hypothetical protein